MGKPPVVSVLLIGYLGILFFLTLRAPAYVPRQRVHLIPFDTIRWALRRGGALFTINVLGNLLAFVPLGCLLPLWSARLRSAWAIGWLALLTSVTIEVLQWGFTLRVADIDDVILNVVGALIGYAACVLLMRRLRTIREAWS